VLIDWAKGV